MTSSRQKEDAQSGLFDISVTDTELRDALERIDIDSVAHKRYVQSANLRRAKIKAMEKQIRDSIPDFENGGARVRVRSDENDPGYLLTVKPRSGGGFEVSAWESIGVTGQGRAE